MKKIGILTFHRSTNNGAFIQCFALYKQLQRDFPFCKIEVIDYEMPVVKRKIYPSNIFLYLEKTTLREKITKIKRLVQNPNMFKRQREKDVVFASSLEQLSLSSIHICEDSVEQLFEYINKNYDIVVAGSDAIWNYSVRGFPNPYFLDTSVKCQKFSYAASCYGMNYESIPDKERGIIKNILESYEFLGIRDDESGLFLDKIGCGIEPVHTCDPTVLLDVDNLPIDLDLLNSKLEKRGFRFDTRSIGVMGNDAMCKMVREILGNQYQIVSLFNYCKYADVNLYDISPLEWAYIFRLFKLTFTTYFHGTLLSLRNGTPVIAIALENDYTSKHKAKVEDFLERIGLENCYFHTDYNGANYDKIRIKSNELLCHNYKELIIQKMDTEKQSYQCFRHRLDEIIKGEKKNG